MEKILSEGTPEFTGSEEGEGEGEGRKEERDEVSSPSSKTERRVVRGELTINLVLINHKGFVTIVPVAPAVIAATI